MEEKQYSEKICSDLKEHIEVHPDQELTPEEIDRLFETKDVKSFKFTEI